MFSNIQINRHLKISTLNIIYPFPNTLTSFGVKAFQMLQNEKKKKGCIYIKETILSLQTVTMVASSWCRRLSCDASFHPLISLPCQSPSSVLFRDSLLTIKDSAVDDGFSQETVSLATGSVSCFCSPSPDFDK